MSDDNDINMEFDKAQDVPPDVPVPAGFYEGIVAGVQVEGPDESRADSLYPKCPIARITYRLNEDGSETSNKRIQSFPMPLRGDKDSWKWFKWCESMGYDTTKGFRFSPDDVEGVPVSLEFGPPRAGKAGTKNEGKMFDNLVKVARLAG